MISSNDTILVTGATGFTGSHLVRALCELGANVRVIARASSNREALSDLNIEWFVGEVYDEAVIATACADVNYVFHMAAAYREAKISDDIYWKVHVQSTQLLAKYAQQNKNLKRFLHTSTVGVHGHIANPPADEGYRFAPGDEYQNTKVEAEKWITNFAKNNALPVTVVRPAAIYGPGDRRLLKVFKLAKLPVCPLLGIGSKGLYHLVHVNDLVDFCITAATHERSLSETYICGYNDPISTQDMVRTISQRLGKKPRFLRLPVTPFFLLGDICEFICKPLGIEPPIYRRRVAFFTKDRSFDTTKSREQTDFEYQYSNQRGIDELTDWYKNNGWL